VPIAADDTTVPITTDDTTVPTADDDTTVPTADDDTTVSTADDDTTVSTADDDTTVPTATVDNAIVAVPGITPVTSNDTGKGQGKTEVVVSDSSEHHKALSALEKSMHIPLCKLFDCAGHPLYENELERFFHSDGFCMLSPEDMEDIADCFKALATVCRKSKAESKAVA